MGIAEEDKHKGKSKGMEDSRKRCTIGVCACLADR